MGKHRKPQKPQRGDAKSDKSLGQQRSLANGNAKASKATSKTSPRLLLEPRADWYAADLPRITIPDKATMPSAKLIQTVHDYANSLLDSETTVYTTSYLKSSSSHKFMTTVMTSGTWSDKVSALTLVVQESPIHTRKELGNLLGMAGRKSRDNALMALAALKDLLAQGTALPSDRKLRYFNKQPELLGALHGTKPNWTSDAPLPNGISKAHLIAWAYEDWLKHSFFEMLRSLETWCNDTVENARMRAVTYVFELLKEKPEQEENLLRVLVNKLGDTGKKIPSRTSYLLLQLQTFHPQMKSIIVDSIQSEILLRPGQSSHAKYYAAITLNQMALSVNDAETPSKLLDVYFSIFVSLLNKAKRQYETTKKSARDKTSKKRKRADPEPVAEVDKAESELDDKIVGQILTGIHRAFPYCKSESAKFEQHLDTMFRITHSSNFNTSIQALQLIQQISSSLSISNDRFMRTLYESLLDPRLIKSSKQTMYLNLLYRALKADASMRRVKAFVKRLMQILALHEPPFICGALYLIHELGITLPGLKTMFDQPEIDEDDDEEVFHDMPDSDDEAVLNSVQQDAIEKPQRDAYDPRKRDPDHSNADKACLWELRPWTMHYHPSTTLFARSLLYPSSAAKEAKCNNEALGFPAKPDPTAHTLIHFLDRFAYRNPKASATSGTGPPARGTSLMQPAHASSSATDTLFTRSRHGDMLPFPSATTAPGAGAGLPTANSEAFWSRQISQIPADEVFFHRYFSDVGPRRKAAAAKRAAPVPAKGAVPDDEWDEDIGAGEDEIWKALVGSRPELEDGEESAASDGSVDDDFADAMDGDETGNETGDDEGVEIDLQSDDDAPDKADDDDDKNPFDDDDGSPLELEDGGSMFSDEDDSAEEEARPPSKKQKHDGKGADDKKKKKKLSSLPMFASVEDYAQMIDDADEDGLDEG